MLELKLYYVVRRWNDDKIEYYSGPFKHETALTERGSLWQPHNYEIVKQNISVEIY